MPQKTTKDNPKNVSYLPTLIYCLAFFVIGLFFFLQWGAHQLQLSVPEFVVIIKDLIYISFYNNFNIFPIGNYNKTNILQLYYQFLFITIILAIIAPQTVIAMFKKDVKVSRLQIIPTIGFIGLVFFIVVQQVGRVEKLTKETDQLANKTEAEKNLTYFSEIYQFTKISRDFLKDRTFKGKIVTDIDLGATPYETYYRVLTYHFYPNIVLRYADDRPSDAIVYFYAKEPFKRVPKGYRIIISTQSQNLALAVKEIGDRHLRP